MIKLQNNQSSSKNIKQGVVLSYLSMGISIFVSLLYTPFVIRKLGQNQYGLYQIGAAVIGYLSILNFGLGSTVIRYASKYKAENKEKQERSLYGLFITVFSFLAVIVMISGIVIACFKQSIFKISTGQEGYRQLGIILIVMTVNLAVSFPASVYSSIITTYERFTFLKSVTILTSLLTPSAVIPVLLLGYKAVGLTIAAQTVHILASFSYIVYVHLRLKVKISFDFSVLGKDTLKSIFGFTVFIFIGVLIDQLYWSTDKIILSMFISETAVAVYAVGAQLHSYYQQFSGSISEVLFPRITKMVTLKTPKSELTDLFIKIGRMQNYILTAVLFGFVVLGKEFIGFWAGKGYEDAYVIALLVLAPATVPLIQSIGFLIIKAMNKHRFRAITYLIIAVLNAATSIPAAISFGGIGCALCTCVCALIGHGFIMNWYYYKKIGLDIPKFWRKNIPIILLSAGVGTMAIVINSFLVSGNILLFLIKAVLFVAAVFVLQYFINMNDFEKGIIKKLFSKFVKI